MRRFTIFEARNDEIRALDSFLTDTEVCYSLGNRMKEDKHLLLWFLSADNLQPGDWVICDRFLVVYDRDGILVRDETIE